jgi:23S rRNA-/tRNA-specific pseudouridylate synthase
VKGILIWQTNAEKIIMLKFEKHIVLTQPQTVLDCLSDNTNFSKQQLKQIMQNGAVWLENNQGINRVRRAKKNLSADDQLHFYYDEAVQNSKLLEAELIADEGAYSVWNKPSGMYSQGSKWGDHCTLYRYAEMNLVPQRPAFIVHRLDRAANGLILLAHKKTIAASLSKMFENREIYKKYKARVEGVIEGIELPYEIKNMLDEKLSISRIVSLNVNEAEKTTDVEMEIQTGRKHQIRRHLSGLGYPIVGDRLYGKRASELDLQLSAVNIRFKCPVTGELRDYEI